MVPKQARVLQQQARVLQQPCQHYCTTLRGVRDRAQPRVREARSRSRHETAPRACHERPSDATKTPEGLPARRATAAQVFGEEAFQRTTTTHAKLRSRFSLR